MDPVHKVLNSYEDTTTVLGFVGVDVFGRKFIDKCPSEEHHLTKAVVPEGEERPGCRIYLDDLIPQMVVGLKVRGSIKVQITVLRGDTCEG